MGPRYNKEALLSLLGFQPSDKLLSLTLWNEGLDEGAEYLVKNYPKICKAAIPIVRTLLSTPNVTSANTGQSVSYDRGAVLEWIKQLEKEAGTNQPSIKSATHHW